MTDVIIIPQRFMLRRGTAATLASVNEVPLLAEVVVETDTGLDDGRRKFKIGDGVTHWNDLPYFIAGGGIESIVAGDNITVDDTDPLNPIVSAAFDQVFNAIDGNGDICIDGNNDLIITR